MLITLGIIGIVAALTMPTLVANYQKKILETRIKKFYSVLNEAVNMKKVEDGGMDGSMLKIAYSADEAQQFFDVNYGPYMKTVVVEKGTRGLLVGFQDGAGMYIQKESAIAGASDIYVMFCVEYKKCKELDGLSGARSKTDGKSTFVFWYQGETARNNSSVLGYKREDLLNGCISNKYYCSRVLQYDGWEVKDDYPW